ncbi:hypothetical protein A6V39_04635 [Candidatus Mycoplasma haematobovis]|uniref:Uncharacterized protein n=1 Tax=Candidatus Mycoplasma haematobovis TaxID=432608 RepID=A0A1A9QDU3_9MOLU|nr:hypothetical protein A6V39_04635 [Candidatus Mycoplasma haematobovis]
MRNSGSSQNRRSCEDKDLRIPEISIEALTKETKETKELFCLKKDHGNNGSKNIVSDFLYLISKQQSWILFKDKEGIHALTYNEEAFEDGEKTEKLKKHLINLKDFDLKGKLRKHLSEHFERLILGNWNSFLKENNKEFKELVMRLNEFLLRSSYSSKLFHLRKALLKDFQINFEDILQKKEGKFENSQKLSFAGKFPYEFFNSQGQKILIPDNKDNLHEKMIPHLENAYLLRLGKNSKVLISTDSFWDVKKSYEKYIEQSDKLFGPASNRKKWDSFNFFEFGNSSVSTVSTKLEVKKTSLLNFIWVSLLREEKLIEVLLQEKIKNGLDFFDFSEWKLKGKKDFNKSAEVEFKDGKGTQIKEKIILSYLHLNYLSLAKDFDILQILGNFDLDKSSNSTQLEDFFEKILRKSKIINSANGYGVSNGGVALELFTIKWLSENKFENFRKHLREILKRNSLAAFVFSKKFSEKEKCLPTTRDKTKISGNLEIPKDIKKNSYIFRSTQPQPQPQPKEEWACPIDKDMVDFASVTTESTTGTKYLTGYKGLVNGNWKDFFPEDIVSKLEHSSPLWKDLNSLINYIDESINSEDKYEELIKILKNLFPSYSWDFEGTKCEKLVFDWRTGIRGSSCFEKSDSSFKDKKEQLKQYLEKGHKADRNSSSTRLDGGKQLLDEKLFNSKNDWFTDKDGNYLISSSDGNEYQIYLIQIKYDDVKDQSSWTDFLKTINSSPFFRELVKVAKDPKVQKQALLSELNSGTGSLKSFKTGDDRLKRILGYSWLNLKN